MILIGVGIGIANPAVARIALGVVPPQRTGMASGISNTFRIGGLSIGVAALGAIFQQRLATGLQQHLGKPEAALARAVASGGIPEAAKLSHGSTVVVLAAREAFASGMNVIFVVGAAIAIAGAVAAFTLVRSRDFVSHTAGPGPGSPDPKSQDPEGREHRVAPAELGG
jgi:hypothetical protein